MLGLQHHKKLGYDHHTWLLIIKQNSTKLWWSQINSTQLAYNRSKKKSPQKISREEQGLYNWSCRSSCSCGRNWSKGTPFSPGQRESKGGDFRVQHRLWGWTFELTQLHHYQSVWLSKWNKEKPGREMGRLRTSAQKRFCQESGGSGNLQALISEVAQKPQLAAYQMVRVGGAVVVG